MLSLLGICLLAIAAAGFVWWLIGFADKYIGPELTRLARGLVVIFTLAFVILKLWGARGAFHV